MPPPRVDGTGAGAAGAGRAEVRGGVVEQDPTPAAAALDGRAAEGQVAQPGGCRRTQRMTVLMVLIVLGPYAWSCPNGLILVFTAKTSLSQFSCIH